VKLLTKKIGDPRAKGSESDVIYKLCGNLVPLVSGIKYL